MKAEKDDKSGWAIGGMTMVGVGVGIIFVQKAPLITVGSIIIGIGLGLLIASLLSVKKAP